MPRELEPKLTKKRMRSQKRAEKAEAKRKEASVRKRNVVLGAGGITILGGIVLYLASQGQGLGPQSPSYSKPESTPIADSSSGTSENPVRVIQEEIIRRALKLSIEEQERWKGVLNSIPQDIPSSIEGRVQRTKMIVKEIRKAMAQSENPIFSETEKNLAQSISENKIKLHYDASYLGEKTDAATSFGIDNGALTFTMLFNSDQIPQDSPMFVALAISHEYIHFLDANQFISDFSDLSADEQYNKLNERITNKDEYVKEEMRGYAQGSRAFLVEQGLLQFYVSPDFSPALDTAAFIGCGQSETNSCWRDYVSTLIIVPSPDETPQPIQSAPNSSTIIFPS